MFVSPSERCLLDKERRQDFTFWRISNLPHSPAQPGAHLAPCWLAPGAILAMALCLCFKRQRGLPNGQRECVEGSACYRTSTCSALCGGGGGRVRCFPSSLPVASHVWMRPQSIILEKVSRVSGLGSIYDQKQSPVWHIRGTKEGPSRQLFQMKGDWLFFLVGGTLNCFSSSGPERLTGW